MDESLLRAALPESMIVLSAMFAVNQNYLGNIMSVSEKNVNLYLT